MKIGAYLTGPFGQSKKIYELRNDVKRGRISKEDLESQIVKEKKEVIGLQQKLNMDFIIDPAFDLFYLLQPFTENYKGVSVGPQENWFNNNVFYRRPQINGPLIIEPGFSEKFLNRDLIPKSSKKMAILPSPYTLMVLSDVQGYKNQRDAICNLSEILKAEANYLSSKGFERIQYDEPAMIVKQSLGSLKEEDLILLKESMKICGKIQGVSTSLHTYFGDAGPIIEYLSKLPVDCIGIDGSETSLNEISKHKYHGKELTLGLIDSRTMSLENPEEVHKNLQEVAKVICPTILWVTTNTATEYRGYTNAVKKLEILARVKELSNE